MSADGATYVLGGANLPWLTTTASEVMIFVIFFFCGYVPPKPQSGSNYGADNASKRLEPLFGFKRFVTQFSIKLTDRKTLVIIL